MSAAGFLIDTNVVSELTRPRPDPGVIAFLENNADALWLPVIVIHELDFGLALLPEGRRKQAIASMIEGLTRDYADRILPLGREEAAAAARLRARASAAGRAAPLADALIAGIAQARGLTVVTRNASDFAPMGAATLDPFAQ